MAEARLQASPQNGLRRTSHFAKLEALLNSCADRLLTGKDLAQCYATLSRIRRVEEEIACLYSQGANEGLNCPANDRDAVLVAICDQLKEDDVVSTAQRGHAAYLARGGDLKALWARLRGKGTDGGDGKKGTMNAANMLVNVINGSISSASGIPNAVGYALAVKIREADEIIVCLFDERATDEGATHESVNFAALQRLPILFVCETGEYSLGCQSSTRTAGYGLCDRYRAYGIPCEKEDSGDFVKIYEAAGRGIADIRKGLGPRFIEFKMPSSSDQLVQIGDMLPEDKRQEIAAKVECEIAEADASSEKALLLTEEEIVDEVRVVKKLFSVSA